MTTPSPIGRYQMLGLALKTAEKIENESRHREPNLRRLVLLSNTYDVCSSQIAATPYDENADPEEQLLFLSDEDLQESSQRQSATHDDADSEEDPDEWSDDSDSELEEEEAPPEYSLYDTSPGITVSVCEYCSAEDSYDDDDGKLCAHVIAEKCEAFRLRGDKESSGCPPTFIEDLGPKEPIDITAGRCRSLGNRAKTGFSRVSNALRAIVA